MLTRTSTSTLVVDAALNAPSAPWTYDYVGNTIPTIAAATQTGNTIQLQSDGCCVGGVSDNMVFTYQPFSGDGAVSSRIDSVSGTTGSAGLMVRAGLDPGAPYVSLSLSQLFR